MGLVRLGGYIGNNDITPQMHAELVDQNNDLLMVANNMRVGLTRRRSDTPTRAARPPDQIRAARPPDQIRAARSPDQIRAARPSDDEDEDFEEEGTLAQESPSEYGAPRSVAEPEPHVVREERHPPGHEPEMEAVPEDDLPEYTNRMERLRRQLEEQMEEAALVGDEVSAESLNLQLRTVESLQLSLPRHTLT